MFVSCAETTSTQLERPFLFVKKQKLTQQWLVLFAQQGTTERKTVHGVAARAGDE